MIDKPDECISVLFTLGGEPLEFYVDADTARTIETAAVSNPNDFVTFYDISGARQRYRASYYAGCTKTTTEQRETMGFLNEALNADAKRGERVYKKSAPWDEQEEGDE